MLKNKIDKVIVIAQIIFPGIEVCNYYNKIKHNLVFNRNISQYVVDNTTEHNVVKYEVFFEEYICIKLPFFMQKNLSEKATVEEKIDYLYQTMCN